ncbi:MAG: hypothetical protein ABIT38_12375 [Gemmatimonadaceae bacterium]
MTEDIVAIGGFFRTVTVLGLWIPLVRAWSRKRELDASRNTLGPGADDRLLRIEQAIDAMSVEIERIAEGQRYVVRVMAEMPAEHAAVEGVAQLRISR